MPQLLRVATAGSVDDGTSTLIGLLLSVCAPNPALRL
jgi:sulfate adenylyltransferase subunit 1 (EFTu-like GTPase family)